MSGRELHSHPAWPPPRLTAGQCQDWQDARLRGRPWLPGTYRKFSVVLSVLLSALIINQNMFL